MMVVAIGMRVRLQPQALRTRNLRDIEFTVGGPIVGTGRDTFMKLVGPGGRELPTWFRSDELRAPEDCQKRVDASDRFEGESLLARARQLVADNPDTLQFSDALKKAATEDRVAAVRHLDAFGASEAETPVTPPAVISLHRHENETFAELVQRVAREERLEIREAVRVVGRAYPALARAHAQG